MRNTVKAFLLAAGVLLSLTGCQKGSFGKVGQEVRFGAVTGQPETRTSYSNSNESETTGWERIDWKQGDIFRVYSSVAARSNGSHFSDYYVNSGTKAGKISEASIENNEAGGLVWGEGENDFYALFPYNAFEVTEVTDAPGKVSAAKAAIPATQELTKAEDGEYYPDMKYAYMLALAKEEAKSTVELNFYPYFTAFEFEVCADKTMEITGFKMISTDKVKGYSATPLSGEFTATPNNNIWEVDKAPTISDENRSVTATFAEPIKLTLEDGKEKTNSVHFTVFAAPRNLTSITVEFTVKVEGKDNEITRSLFISYSDTNKLGKTAGDPVEFAARKKHYFKGFFIRDNYDADGLIFYLEPMWEIKDLGSTSNANNVQCTQFVVGPANVVQNAWDDRLKAPTETAAQERGLTGDEYDKFVDPIKNASRQTWEFLTDGSATIDYSIMLPKAGTWRVEVCGDTEAFTVTPTSGRLSAATTGSTIINIKITPNKTSAGGTIWLKTFAKMEDGTEYSLDSETQLYDLRGYHKFVYNPSHEYTSNYIE